MRVKVSVIMPVYNCEKYLADSIKSVLAQTFTDFELIIIDDGSKDKSRKIIEEYSLKDTRIKAFYNENHGVSFTRNYGIDHASGEYIAFIDADDLYEKDYLKDMTNLIKDSDFICCYNNLITSKGRRKSIYKFDCSKVADLMNEDNDYSTYQILLEKGIGIQLWNKLFKTCFLKSNNLKFESNYSYDEDMFFCWKATLFSKKITVLDKCLYLYRLSPASQTLKYHSDLIYQYEEMFNQISNIMKKKNSSEVSINSIGKYLLNSKIEVIISMIARSGLSYCNKKEELNKILKNNFYLKYKISSKIVKMLDNKRFLILLLKKYIENYLMILKRRLM